MQLLLRINSPVSPEGLNLAVRNHDTTEGDESHNHQRIDKRGEDSVGRIRCDGLSDGCVKQFVHYL
jgi:hypothetical protein